MKKVLVTLSLAGLLLWAGSGVVGAAMSKISGNISDDGVFSAIADQKNSFKIDNSNYAYVDVYTKSEAESGKNEINVGDDGADLSITAGEAEASSQVGLDVNSLEVDIACCETLADEAEVEISGNVGDDVVAEAETYVLYEEEVINSNDVDFYQDAEVDAETGENKVNVGEDAEGASVSSGKGKSSLIKTDFLNWFKWSKS